MAWVNNVIFSEIIPPSTIGNEISRDLAELSWGDTTILKHCNVLLDFCIGKAIATPAQLSIVLELQAKLLQSTRKSRKCREGALATPLPTST